MGAGPRVEPDPAFHFLAAAARAAGAEAWAVGGYVRDRLLGRPHHEIDVVVLDGRGPAMADRFAELAGSSKPVVFERFGTAQVVWQGRPIEFASAAQAALVYDPGNRFEAAPDDVPHQLIASRQPR